MKRCESTWCIFLEGRARINLEGFISKSIWQSLASRCPDLLLSTIMLITPRYWQGFNRDFKIFVEIFRGAATILRPSLPILIFVKNAKQMRGEVIKIFVTRRESLIEETWRIHKEKTKRRDTKRVSKTRDPAYVRSLVCIAYKSPNEPPSRVIYDIFFGITLAIHLRGHHK